ncbi:hypothetical protein ACXYMX_09530 [Sporosarcina sp. CAU 1771]
MISRNGIIKSIVYGVVSGVFLTLLFKQIEQVTLYRVYTLLLNVDYIPILNEYQLSESIEVLFHLIVSVAVSICLYIALIILKLDSKKKAIYFSIAVCTLIGGLLYPTTAFSERTPEITSLPSIFYWLVGHALYGCLLGYLFSRIIKKSSK